MLLKSLFDTVRTYSTKPESRMLRTLTIISVLYTSFVFGKVYDCLMFFNEYEVLDLRFHEMYDYVDHFVIVEACEGFTGKPKNFRFEEQLERYAPFLDKVIYVKLHEKQVTDDPWVREAWQRNQIMRGLVQCDPDDVILVSDCDEIVPGKMIPEIVESLKDNKIVGLVQQLSAYRLNRLWTDCHEFEWKGTACTKYCTLNDIEHPEALRVVVHFNQDPSILWKKGGWHFSYMGGLNRNIEKCNNFSHANPDAEYDPSYDEWRAHVDTMELVPIDETFPQYVQDNKDHLIDIGLIDPY